MLLNLLIVTFTVLLFSRCGLPKLQGDHVCRTEHEKEEMEIVKHERKIVLTTYVRCFDFSQNFRCKVQREGTKKEYVNAPKKTKVQVEHCCDGYYATENETCIACEEGLYGFNCTQECNCTETQICHHRLGCCDPTTECGLPQSDAYQNVAKADSGSWMIPVLVATVSAAAVLLFGLVFYRKKYMKEKDPDLPTLTYYPDVKGYVSPMDESREFNNPLYRQSAFETTLKEDPSDVGLKGKQYFKEEPVQNEYATMDEIIDTVSAGPSSRVPLLHDENKYEVPYRFTPSPECRINENENNIKKELS